MRSTPIKSLTGKWSCRYRDDMDSISILCLAIVIGHVITVCTITFCMKQVAKDMKAIALEREETNRSYYASGPGVATDNTVQRLHSGAG